MEDLPPNLPKATNTHIQSLAKGDPVKSVNSYRRRMCKMNKSAQDNGKSRYILLKSEISSCPLCNNNAYLLTSDESSKGKPSFFICFDCKSIGEVGIGKVREEN